MNENSITVLGFRTKALVVSHELRQNSFDRLQFLILADIAPA
jgi:hypothetical protein